MPDYYQKTQKNLKKSHGFATPSVDATLHKRHTPKKFKPSLYFVPPKDDFCAPRPSSWWDPLLYSPSTVLHFDSGHSYASRSKKPSFFAAVMVLVALTAIMPFTLYYTVKELKKAFTDLLVSDKKWLSSLVIGFAAIFGSFAFVAGTKLGAFYAPVLFGATLTPPLFGALLGISSAAAGICIIKHLHQGFMKGYSWMRSAYSITNTSDDSISKKPRFSNMLLHKPDKQAIEEKKVGRALLSQFKNTPLERKTDYQNRKQSFKAPFRAPL